MARTRVLQSPPLVPSRNALAEVEAMVQSKIDAPRLRKLSSSPFNCAAGLASGRMPALSALQRQQLLTRARTEGDAVG